LTTYTQPARAPSAIQDHKLPFVIGASAIGTVIEWYDFYLYAVLAVFLAPVFFPGDPTSQTLSALATFGAGFAVRPFGAVVFGRIGHTLPHAPQLFASFVVSTHAPEHDVRPVAHAHTPPVQTIPAPHA